MSDKTILAWLKRQASIAAHKRAIAHQRFHEGLSGWANSKLLALRDERELHGGREEAFLQTITYLSKKPKVRRK